MLSVALTVASNYENINKNPQRISKIRPFSNQYNWKGINFPSNKEDWKKFEPNNKSTALNIFVIFIYLFFVNIYFFLIFVP